VRAQYLTTAARAALIIGLGLSGSTIATSALAQTTPASPSSDQATILPEVIVQARRVDENQEHVPVAVTSLSTQALRYDTVTQVADLAKSVPSFEVDPGSLGGAADPVFTVRGLSGALVADPSVVAYFDQVASDPRNFAYSMYDLESVQILKGPQGTLFGKNSTGGAVTFAPIRPNFNYGGYVDFRYGNYNDRDVSAAVNLPLFKDVLAMRVAGDFENRNGTLTSVTGGGRYNDRDHGSARFELVFTPGHEFENYLQASIYHVRENGNQAILSSIADCSGAAPNIQLCAFQPPFNTAFGTPNVAQFLANQQKLGINQTESNFNSPFNVDYDAVTDIMTGRLGPFTFKNIAHIDYARYDIAFDLTGTGLGILNEDDHQSNHNYSDELQFIGKAFDDRLSWIVGAYYDQFQQAEHEGFEFDNFALNPFSPQNITLSQPQESEAVFAQTTVDFSPWVKGLSLTTGYRYTWDGRSITQQRLQKGSTLLGVTTCGLAGFPGLNTATCTEHLSTEFSNYNYDISLNWQATRDTLVYLATRRGYKSGGFNFASTIPQDIEYAPETVTDVEFGLKTDWRILGVPVRTNLAAYRGDYDDIQAQFILNNNGLGIPAAVVLNEDAATGTKNKATLEGGEAEVTFVPIHDLTVNGYYGYASGRYNQFIDSTQTPPVSLAGQAVQGISNNTFGLNLQYRPHFDGIAGPMTFSADLYSRSKESANQLNPSIIGGYTNLDLRFDWRNAMGGPVDVALYGTNVTNDRHVIVDNQLLEAVGTDSKIFADPTMYGIELRYHFGA
jgi:iron complex outermembrane recepter protein